MSKMYNKEIPCDICGQDVRMDDFAVSYKGKPICTACAIKVTSLLPEGLDKLTYGTRKLFIEEAIKEAKDNVKVYKITECGTSSNQ